MKTRAYEIELFGRDLELVINYEYQNFDETVYVDDYFIIGEDLVLSDEEKLELGKHIEKLTEREQHHLPDYINEYQNSLADYFTDNYKQLLN